MERCSITAMFGIVLDANIKIIRDFTRPMCFIFVRPYRTLWNSWWGKTVAGHGPVPSEGCKVELLISNLTCCQAKLIRSRARRDQRLKVEKIPATSHFKMTFYRGHLPDNRQQAPVELTRQTCNCIISRQIPDKARTRNCRWNDKTSALFHCFSHRHVT